MSKKTLLTPRGIPVPIGSLLGEGAEGRVHEVPGHPALCAKILHAPSDAVRAKLTFMVENPPAGSLLASLAWPLELLAHDGRGGGLAGYLMPRAPAGTLPVHRLFDAEDRERLGARLNFADLLSIAQDLARVVAALHAAGHHVGDLNESNVLVTPAGRVLIIDCDSFGISEPGGTLHPGGTGKVEYTAPELTGVASGGGARTAWSDAFSLAVLLFQLQMEGNSPFRARWRLPGAPAPTEERIRRGLYPHEGWSLRVAPPEDVPSITSLPSSLRAAFQRAFVDGRQDPGARPGAADWVRLLDAVRPELETSRCGRNPEHRYFGHMRACPWCRRSRLLGRDPFPAPARSVGADETMVTPWAALSAAVFGGMAILTWTPVAGLRPLLMSAPLLLGLIATGFLVTAEDESPARGLLRRCAGMSLIPLLGLWLPRIASAFP